MDIQLHAPVVSKDGAELGKIDRVVFDPQTGHTKSIVIRKGLILARDVAVPTEEIRVAAPSRVELDMTKEEVDKMPDFVETDYAWPSENWIAPYGWPAGAVMWPMAYPGGVNTGYPAIYPDPAYHVPDEVRERARQEDIQNAVVGQGAEVLSMNGEKVGSVDNMMVDPDTNKPARIVMKRGFLFTEDVELPGDWIESYDDGKVVLNVDKPTVENLAKHQQR